MARKRHYRKSSRQITWVRRPQKGRGAIRRKKVDPLELMRHIMRRLGFYILLFGLMIVVFSPFWGWKLLESHPVFTIQRVLTYTRDGSELQYLSQERIDSLTATALNENFVGFNVGEYQRMIMAEPWIKNVKVERVWFDQLNVIIEEERPIAIWNEDALIDKEGVIFQPEEIPYGRLPRLEGSEVYRTELIENLFKVQSLLALHNLKVDTLTLDERRSWSILLENGILLLFGTEEFDERFERFINHYAIQIAPREDEIIRIDFRYRDGFSVKWR